MNRTAWLLLLACTGCQSLSTLSPVTPKLPAPTPVREPAPVAATRAEAALDPDFLLGRATSLAAQGDHEAAAEQLTQYITLRPEHLSARAQLGELLFRQGKHEEARLQLELFIALAQDHGEPAFRHLIHCHSRLVEIAEEQNNDYEEHLNRGIGLFLLAVRRAGEADPNGDCSANSLLCRAATELQAARQDQPDQARSHLYLYQTWKRLGQHSAAVRSLHTADHHALLSRLTPLERRELQAACVGEQEALRTAR
jgi:Tfp pilus assembly protein PilF